MGLQGLRPNLMIVDEGAEMQHEQGKMSDEEHTEAVQELQAGLSALEMLSGFPRPSKKDMGKLYQRSAHDRAVEKRKKRKRGGKR